MQFLSISVNAGLLSRRRARVPACSVTWRPLESCGSVEAPPAEGYVPFIRERKSNYPNAWAEIVAGSISSNDVGPTRGCKDGTISASVASTSARAVPAARAPASVSQMHVKTLVPIHIPVETHPIFQAGRCPSISNSNGFGKHHGCCDRGPLETNEERLEATIMPMQRTLESLQAEFIALRAEEQDEAMTSGAAADAKRLRLGADV